MREIRRIRQGWYGVLLAVVALGVGRPCPGRAASSAERLAARVPEGTLAFVATSGEEEVRPAFEKTVLSQFLSDPNVRPVVDQVVAWVEKGIGRGDDPTAKALLGLAKAAYRRPILAGIASVQDPGTGGVFAFVFVDGGPQKEEIESALRRIEDSEDRGLFADQKVGDLTIRTIKDRGAPVYWGWVDRTFVFGVNDPEHRAIQACVARRSASLPAALEGLPSRGDGLILHADLKRLHGLMMSMAKDSGDPDLLRVVTALSRELALSDLQALTLREGFQDKGLASDGLLQTANPKGPILGLVRAPDLAMLDAANADTIAASLWNLDLAGLYDLILRTAKAVAPPEDPAEIETAVAEVEGKLGFKIREDLLAGLAGPMALYAVEVPNASPPSGSILMAKLSRPEAVDKALAALAKAAVDHGKGSLQMGTSVQDGHTVRCISGTALALAQVMPTWVVAKDRLIVATNTALCTRALQQWTSGTAPKTPLRETASYRQVLGTLPQGLVSLQYTDTPRQFRQFLLGIQPYWPLVTVAAARAGIQLPVALPRFDRIVDRLPPSGSTCWQDKDGLRWHSEGSSVDSSAIAGVAVGAGIAMPALAKARTQAQRVISMNNLKQIGLACILYADAHNGSLPASLQSLVDAGQIPAKVLQSPRGSSAGAKPFYLYLSGQTTQQKDPALTIVAYEDPDQTREGVNAVFMDGHVEFLRHEAFQKRLEETYKRLGREIPTD